MYLIRQDAVELGKLEGDHRIIHGSIECSGKFKQSLNFIEHAFKQSTPGPMLDKCYLQCYFPDNSQCVTHRPQDSSPYKARCKFKSCRGLMYHSAAFAGTLSGMNTLSEEESLKNKIHFSSNYR